jgi:hypothetical protein
MGLSFHYSGSIAKPEYLNGLIQEVRDIVSVLGWKYLVHENQFPEELFGQPDYNNSIYGISFTPPQCETVSISFLSNGRISDLNHLLFFGRTEKQSEQKYLYMLSVKTQYAGVVVHQFVIHLFRHLNKKYFVDFSLIDEGKYWETSDEELLKTTFKKYTDLLDNFSFAFDNFPAQPGEKIENYLERIFLMIKKVQKL